MPGGTVGEDDLAQEGTFSARCRVSVDAPPELAFRLWSEAELLGAWMGGRESGGGEKPRLVGIGDVEIAPEPGTPFRLDMITREADGSNRTWVHEGEVVSASPPGEISLTWISEGTGHASTLLTLTFAPDGEGTAVELLHEGFSSPEMADDHAEGWDLLLELFSEAMVSAAGAGLKIVAAELKRRLAMRTAADRVEDAQADAEGPLDEDDEAQVRDAEPAAGGAREPGATDRDSSPQPPPG
jgi:uncharacterized protein YndB with AHSA1/START domain